VKRLTLWVLGLALIAAVSPTIAQGNRFKIFVAAAYVSPLSDEQVEINNTIDTLEASSELGWNLGFEWRATKWFGLEVDYLRTDHDLEFAGQLTVGQISYKPLSFSANFHVVHTRIVDFWLAPTYSYVVWGNVEVPNDNDITTKTSNALGATLGLDLSFFKFMAVTLGVRYTRVEIDTDQGDSASVDPLMARAGLSFRF